MAKSRTQSKKATATLDAAAAQAPARSASGEPASAFPVILSRTAFVLTLAVVIARALMTEVVREAVDVIPNGMAAPAAPGPAATLFLNALCCLPAILVLVRRAIERRFTLRWTWSQVFFGLLAIWSAASVMWSADKFTAVVYASSMIGGGALVWSSAQLVRSWTRLRLVAGVCVGLLLVYAVQGLIYKFVDVPNNIAYWEKNKEQILLERGWDENSFQAQQFAKKLIGGEMVGFNTSPNSYAAVIVMLSVITVGAAVHRRVNGDPIAWSIALLLPLIPAFIALWFTQTRTAAGTLFIAGLAMVLLSPRGLREWLGAHSRLAYSIVLLAVAFGIAAVVGHGLYRHSLPSASLNFRWRYWVAGFAIFLQHPLTGIGWGNFGNYYVSTRLAAAAEETRDPHNFLVRAFVELGLIGGALTIAWIARAAWELSRPITPPPQALDASSAPNKDGGVAAVAMILPIAAAGIVLNMAMAIDWSQDINFLIVECYHRALFLGLLIVGIVLVAVRGRHDSTLDDRPAQWLLYALLIGLGVFLVHNLVDFVIAEPGAMTLFAVLLGAALGLRSPPAPGVKARRSVAMTVLLLAILAWIVSMLTLVIPVADAEQRARQADAFIRGDKAKGVAPRPDIAAKMFESIFQNVPYNADYAFRAARAHIMAGATPDQVRAMLSIAIATEPTNVSYRLTRAGEEMRQPQPDVGMIRGDFDAAVRLDPHNIQGRLAYADALQKFGDSAGAAAQIRHALDTNRQYDPTEPERLAPDEVQRLENLAAQLERDPATRPAPSPATQSR